HASDGFVWDGAGNMYVSDWTNNAIQKYDSSGNYAGVFASGSSLSGPLDLRIGANGNFFVNSFNNGTVKEFDGTSGAFVGNFITGLGTTQGQLLHPDGTLLVGSYGGNSIRRYNATTGAFIGTFAN